MAAGLKRITAGEGKGLGFRPREAASGCPIETTELGHREILPLALFFFELFLGAAGLELAL